MQISAPHLYESFKIQGPKIYCVLSLIILFPFLHCFFSLYTITKKKDFWSPSASYIKLLPPKKLIILYMINFEVNNRCEFLSAISKGVTGVKQTSVSKWYWEINLKLQTKFARQILLKPSALELFIFNFSTPCI